MKNSQLIVSILIIILIVVLGVFLLNSSPTDIDVGNNVDDGGNHSDVLPDTFIPDEIIATFSYEDGLHEYFGSIDFPNSCYALTTEALVRESFPEQVTLVFEADAGDRDALCAQVITPRAFRIIFSASEQATVNAEFNGQNVDLFAVEAEALDLVEGIEVESLE